MLPLHYQRYWWKQQDSNLLIKKQQFLILRFLFFKESFNRSSCQTAPALQLRRASFFTGNKQLVIHNFTNRLLTWFFKEKQSLSYFFV